MRKMICCFSSYQTCRCRGSPQTGDIALYVLNANVVKEGKVILPTTK